MTPPTAPREPLVLTLEEAMRMADSEAQFPFVYVWLKDGEWCTKSLAGPHMKHASWPEAYSRAFGRPVVARDEAAELRAENERLRAAIREWFDADRDQDDALTHTAHLIALERFSAAEETLRRLAGEDSE